MKPSTFSDVWEVEVREHTFLVAGTYNPGEPVITSGPADNWYPGSPECVEIEKVCMILVRAGHKKPYERKRAISEPAKPTPEQTKAWDSFMEELETEFLESMNDD